MAQEYSGLAIADYFIKKCLDSGTQVTNMGILKMIYFAHGMAYPRLNRKLIKDPFYAWPWGPVEIKTYEQFKEFGANFITSVSGQTTKEQSAIENDNELKVFLDSFLPLAKIDPFKLSRKSHEVGGPWFLTDYYKIIDDKIIESFFNGRYRKQ